MKVWTQRPDHGHAAARVPSRTSQTLTYDPVYGPPQTIDGFKLVDGRASYGVGLETFALGFPIHFDWSWRTLFNKDYEDYVFAYQGIQEGDDAAASGSGSRGSRSGSATTSKN